MLTLLLCALLGLALVAAVRGFLARPLTAVDAACSAVDAQVAGVQHVAA